MAYFVSGEKCAGKQDVRMDISYMKKMIPLLIVGLMLTSCVSNKVFNSMKAEAMRNESEVRSVELQVEALQARCGRLEQACDSLAADTARLGAMCRSLGQRYGRLLEDGSAEAARMLRELERSQQELQARSLRMEELERSLTSREEALLSIRRKVADALLGFDGKGLSISTRDGKVYVSMDDKLLFRSGSYEIGTRGAEAVRELAGVLAQNKDINVMVEGHTDDVPYVGRGALKDNLDLSAKRATTVVRLILENKEIDPARIIAAGRGESLPVATGKTPEVRQQNRRTEIILTPRLDELMQLMD